MPKMALKISGFTLSVNCLGDKIAKPTEIFLLMFPHTLPTPTHIEMVN